MLLYFDIDSKKLLSSPGGPALVNISAKRGEEEEIAIQVIQDGAPIELVAPRELKFVAKSSGHYDEDPLVEAVDFEYDSDSKIHRATVNWIIDVLNELFGVQSDPVTISGGVAATNVITTSTPHGLIGGDRFYFPSLTGGLPLESGTDSEVARYFVKTTPSTTTLTLSATLNGTEFDFTTAITGGTLRKDPVDVASVPLAIEVAHRADDVSAWKRSENQVALTLYNNYLRDDDGAAAVAADNAMEAWLDARAVRFDEAQSLSSGAKDQARQNIAADRVELGFACSDESSAISSGTGKLTFRMPFAMTLTAVRASVKTAPTTQDIIIDINESGTSVLSTKLHIDPTEKTSTTAATSAVISDASLADDVEMTVDFDQVGSGTTGAGVKIWLIGTRP